MLLPEILLDQFPQIVYIPTGNRHRKKSSISLPVEIMGTAFEVDNFNGG